MTATLTRSELARATGVSADTLRHYERKGVLPAPPRTANGYRRYPQEAVTRVALIRRALLVGFTLGELAGVLGERDRGGTPCRRVRTLVETRLAAFEARLSALLALRDELRTLLADWDVRLAQAPPGRPAYLLRVLEGDEAVSAHPGLRAPVERRARPARAPATRLRKPRR
ncbi:MAG: heavy metal-responsive transcriptional regulator [Vicinamibacterales bacterium]